MSNSLHMMHLVKDDPFDNAIELTRDNKAQILKPYPLGFRLTCNFLLRLKRGQIVMILPDGQKLKFSGKEEQEAKGVIVVRDFAFAKRTIFGGDIAFFESYADGQWDTPDLAACLYVIARNADFLQDAFEAIPMITWWDGLRHMFNRNTRSGARKNIMAHYDLGNDFYEQWLDPTMTYSSAIFPQHNSSLEDAQLNKYKCLLNKIQLQTDEHMLEIGSGWGGFAEFAAKNVGAKITGITISKAQYDYACERIQKAQLNEKVTFALRDYRDIEGQYDKIASIEMFEAVGKEYWDIFFNKIHALLRPGGRAGLQIITIADRFFKSYERSTDFIQRYIFPGGMLPGTKLLDTYINNANFTIEQSTAHGHDYAATLNNWHVNFLKNWNSIQPMGFDNRFKKTWQFYLAYCEAGFLADLTDLRQLSIKKT